MRKVQEPHVEERERQSHKHHGHGSVEPRVPLNVAERESADRRADAEQS